MARTARESPTLKLRRVFPNSRTATTVEPLSSVLMSLSKSCWLVLERQLVMSWASSGAVGVLVTFFKELLRFSLHLAGKVLRRLALMKADTRCPLRPCPSQTQKSLMPKGSLS